MAQQTSQDPAVNEGEGSRSAAHRYGEDVEKFLKSHDPQQLGKEAERAVEEDPETYRAAEEAGKARGATAGNQSVEREGR